MVIDFERPQDAERRELLMSVAKTIFAERGFQSTTMDDIAKEAGFTKPILYQYFTSKTNLYRQIVVELADQLLESLKLAVRKAETPRAKIEVAFRVYFDMVVSENAAFRILFIHSHEGETAKEAGGVVGIAEGAAIVWLEQQEAKGWPSPAEGAAERLAARSATLAWGGLRSVHQD